MVRVDAELMRQALLNLVLNGMQAMPDGGAVRVSVRREQHWRWWRSRMTGVGIPETLLPRIFDLYFTTKAKGSGIGLAMTYRILQMHGGAMEVRSTTDAGPRRSGGRRLRCGFRSLLASEMRKTGAATAGRIVTRGRGAGLNGLKGKVRRGERDGAMAAACCSGWAGAVHKVQALVLPPLTPVGWREVPEPEDPVMPQVARRGSAAGAGGRGGCRSRSGR